MTHNLTLARMIARLYRYLFPPSPVDDSNYHRLKRLLRGQEYRPSVPAADVDARLAALRTPTAVERLQADVDRAVAAAEEQMHGEWMERR